MAVHAPKNPLATSVMTCQVCATLWVGRDGCVGGWVGRGGQGVGRARKRARSTGQCFGNSQARPRCAPRRLPRRRRERRGGSASPGGPGAGRSAGAAKRLASQSGGARATGILVRGWTKLEQVGTLVPQVPKLQHVPAQGLVQSGDPLGGSAFEHLDLIWILRPPPCTGRLARLGVVC